ncbi:MAG: hypothetical protein ACRDZW_11605 [Acidimicrobiales bacterium]
MDERRGLLVYGVARVAIGVAFVAAPGPLLQHWIGDDADRPAARFLGRLFGLRDAAIGVGVVLAAREGRSMRRWALLAAAADAGDAVVSLSALGRLPRRGLLAAAAAAVAGSGTGVVLAQRLR